MSGPFTPEQKRIFLAWAREDYNTVKPKQRLRWMTPSECHEDLSVSAKGKGSGTVQRGESHTIDIILLNPMFSRQSCIMVHSGISNNALSSSAGGGLPDKEERNRRGVGSSRCDSWSNPNKIGEYLWWLK